MALPMADGRPWCLPVVGDHLIPDLSRLGPIVFELADHRSMLLRGEIDPGGPADEIGMVWLGLLLCDLLAIQYRPHRRTLIRLIDLPSLGRTRPRVLSEYLPELERFINAWVPLAIASSGAIASNN